MGMGDEILALGRAEAAFERTGIPHSIRDASRKVRSHELWHGNPAWSQNSSFYVIDAPGARPYIKDFISPKSNEQRILFNHDYRPRAGRVFLNDVEKSFCNIEGPFAVISPTIKENASPNKQWGWSKWEKVIEKFPIPVYQLGPQNTQAIQGARHYVTPTMRTAAAVIEKASIVMSNEGGIHHLAASMRRPAVVVFGAFIPPYLTGYDFHENIAVETPEGFCGSWTPCKHCENAMAQITPDMVKQKALAML